MGRIVIVRHGQASFHSADYDQLSVLGRTQARHLGAFWVERAQNIDAVFVGPARRHAQTETEVGSQLKAANRAWHAATVLDELDEHDAFGLVRKGLPALADDPELAPLCRALEAADEPAQDDPAHNDPGRKARAFQRVFEALMHRWIEGSVCPVGVEPWPEFCDRVRRGLERLQQAAAGGKVVVAFSSVGPVAAMVHLSTGCPPARAFETGWRLRNCALSQFHLWARATVSRTSLMPFLTFRTRRTTPIANPRTTVDFAIPTSLEPLLDQARALLPRLEPLERRALSEGFCAVEPDLRALREELRATGLWLPQIPKSAGGLGLSVLEHGLVTEILGASPLGHYAANCQAPDAGNMEVLLEYGTDEQREQFLAPLLAGSIRSCFGMTEPGRAGSNPVWLETSAQRDGDDLVLNGRKWFTTAADGASFCIVMAVTEPDAPPHQRASMVLVPTDAPGFDRVRNIAIMGDAGEGWMSHSEVTLQDVRVPASSVLGEPGAGFAIAQARLGPGRIHHCMRWIGICNRALDMMTERALRRELAPGQPLADKQVIAHWLAESRAQIDAARLLVLEAAWSIDIDGAKAARQKVSIIKFFTSDVLMKVVDRAIQVHGALGMTDDTVLSWFYRHERGSRIYDGPDEVHKSSVARRLLKEKRAEAER